MQITESEKTEIVRRHLEENASIERLRQDFKRGPATIEKILLEKGIVINKRFQNGKPLDKAIINKWIDLYRAGMNFTEIANINSVTSTTVRLNLILAGVYGTKHPDITEETRFEIQKLYNEGLNSRQVAKRLDISKTTVLRNIDAPKERSFYNKYTCDYSYFENIDNQDKAYWLGYLMADGYNSEIRKAVTLGQASQDKFSVYLFKYCLNATHPVHERLMDNIEKYDRQDFYSITINSPKLSEDLAKHGIIQAKTHVAHFPDIDSSLYRHFIRGLFDGDGCFYETGGKPAFSITGNKPLLEKIQDILIIELGFTKPKLYKRHSDRNDTILELRYSNGSVKKFGDWIYEEANCVNLRKYNKFINFKYRPDDKG